MTRNQTSFSLWQFLISCHPASEHDRDKSTEKLRGHTFGSRVLSRTAPQCLTSIHRPVDLVLPTNSRKGDKVKAAPRSRFGGVLTNIMATRASIK